MAPLWGPCGSTAWGEVQAGVGGGGGTTWEHLELLGSVVFPSVQCTSRQPRLTTGAHRRKPALPGPVHLAMMG